MEWVEFIPENKKEERIKYKLLTEKVWEQLVQKFLSVLLEREGFWVKSPINLWSLIGNYEGPLEVLNRYDHPLQPDIDILCARFKENPKTPLFRFEIKLFSKFKQIVMPKTSEKKGYYAGIEQTLSLLTYGLDYATLWQIFLLPFEVWEKKAEVNQIIDENAQWSACYSQFIEQAFIKNLHLPIGYRATALWIQKEQEKVRYLDFYKMDAPPSSVFASTPAKLRILLTKKLKIEEGVYKKQFLEDLIKMHERDKK